ncbi:hypothetical protein [Sporosarcina sp.]|uniref:hypothetical protein n=1 Tax=Sporosarcina sp. TaxID=49982 RepID=UPI00260FB07E|nr:hypothetical protein [Sporosarcina sp.]
MSGPILDRLDFVLSLKSSGLQEDMSSETSDSIKERVRQARLLQTERYGKRFLNGTVPFQLLDKLTGMFLLHWSLISDHIMD